MQRYASVAGESGRKRAGRTPQTEALPGQVANSAGGFSFAVTPWQRLSRFLILGAEGNSYYASQRSIAKDSVKALRECLKLDGKRVVAEIVDVSDKGRAYKNDPALFALAYCCAKGNASVKATAFAALPKVARIGTHLFHFVQYADDLRGWGRGLRQAVANWYLTKTPEQLAFQVVKYPSRDGWSHADVIRKAHPKAAYAFLPQPELDRKQHTEALDAIFAYVTRPDLRAKEKMDAAVKAAKGSLASQEAKDIAKRAIARYQRLSLALEPKLFRAQGIPIIEASELLRRAVIEKPKPADVARIVTDYKLPMEAVPTELRSAEVYEALLPTGGLTWLIRNLGNLGKHGILKDGASCLKLVEDRLTDQEAIRKGRVHPLQFLAALLTYKQGHGMRGAGQWRVVQRVVDALQEGFHQSFGVIEPTGKRFMLGIDVSGSMSCDEVGGIPGLTPALASAAMAMVIARTERDYACRGFATTFIDLGISPRQSLDTVFRKVQHHNFGGTDCALPMQWALQERAPFDCFVVLTDSETWAGRQHPPEALREYRQKMGIPARLVVVGMVSNDFTIADPNDAGMLDVVGFDTDAPNVIADFARGDI